ncbi:MAG: NUDIX hydrolase [Lachnospiraceae bacterium]
MFHRLIDRTPMILDYEQYKKYAVMAPFLPDTREFVFEIRSPKLNRQPGEVCFPGGYIEEGESALEAAVRETMEELLIKKESISVIAPLDIFLSPFNIMVTPYLAELYDFNFTFNPDEVQSLFTVPFDFFLNHEPEIYYNRVISEPEQPETIRQLLGMDSYAWSKGRYPVLFYHYADKLIWGMTARFIYNIVNLYKRQ